jgi:hypothetical protein
VSGGELGDRVQEQEPRALGHLRRVASEPHSIRFACRPIATEVGPLLLMPLQMDDGSTTMTGHGALGAGLARP